MSVYVGATSERLAIAAVVKRLRDEDGLLWRQIAEQLEISRSYAQALYGDPDGAKARARKDSYAGVCVDCGGPTTGSEGRGPKRPRRCLDCRARYQHTDRHWVPEQIIATFLEFSEKVGRSPTVVDSHFRSPSIAAAISPERLAEAQDAWALVQLPSHGTVVREFGSWPKAVAAAGLEPAPTGAPSHRGERELWQRERRVVSPTDMVFNDIELMLEELTG